uniref:Uncharacterized protein n=1 Tax=Oryza sativa subsp. japonica TaxID=39947 RepID=Q69V09_ORYSJ|nr:hypothetical protein [Oryza sativa Japonica Group]BAD30584.1 hypothetical protein [Oryza sativa Japonica Group]
MRRRKVVGTRRWPGGRLWRFVSHGMLRLTDGRHWYCSGCVPIGVGRWWSNGTMSSDR